MSAKHVQHYAGMKHWTEEPYKVVPTFTATIYAGLRVGRSALPPKKLYTVEDAEKICQDYCDKVGLCVTITPTQYVYTKGGEEGVIVGLINYPRFPKEPEYIAGRAMELAQLLLVGLEQFKVTVVFPENTVMIGKDEN